MCFEYVRNELVRKFSRCSDIVCVFAELHGAVYAPIFHSLISSSLAKNSFECKNTYKNNNNNNNRISRNGGSGGPANNTKGEMENYYCVFVWLPLTRRSTHSRSLLNSLSAAYLMFDYITRQRPRRSRRRRYHYYLLDKLMAIVFSFSLFSYAAQTVKHIVYFRDPIRSRKQSMCISYMTYKQKLLCHRPIMVSF